MSPSGPRTLSLFLLCYLSQVDLDFCPHGLQAGCWNAKHFIHLHGQGTKKGGRGGASRVLPLYRQKPPRSPCCELARTGHTTTHPRKVLREQGTRGLWSALTMVAMQISVIAAAWIRVSRDEVTSSFPGQPGGPRTHGGSPRKCQCLLQVGNFYSVFKASPLSTPSYK